MTRSIRAKILGLAGVLVLLLCATTMFTLYKINKVRTELDLLAGFYVPISEGFDQFALLERERDLSIYRLLNMDLSTSSELLKMEASDFGIRLEMMKLASKHIKELISDHARAKQFEQHKALFVSIRKVMLDVNKEYEAYRAIAKTLNSILNGEITDNSEEALIMLRDQGEALDMAIDNAVVSLATFTKDSAHRTAVHERQALYGAVILIIIAFVIGISASIIISSGLVKPLLRLAEGTKEVENGKLDISIEASTRDEVGQLTVAFNMMVGGLRLKERITDTFGKYVDPRIVENLIEDDQAISQTSRRVMSVSFVDIANFTPLSENLSPNDLVEFLNVFLSAMSESVSAQGGVIDKYIGDCVMSFYGPPISNPESHARDACQSALDQRSRLEELRGRFPFCRDLDIRIGIGTGELVVGTIGSDFSKSFTVIGDVVNLAARLESAGKQYGVHSLISDQTMCYAGAEIETREIDLIQVVGRHQPERVYELLAARGKLETDVVNLQDIFGKGLAAYRSQNWETAKKHFQECLEIKDNDGPSLVFLDRIKHLEASPPGDNWDGVWVMMKK